MRQAAWADHLEPSIDPCPDEERWPIGSAPSSAIVLFGAATGWSPEREAQDEIDCRICGRAMDLDEHGVLFVAEAGQVDEEPASVLCVCAGCLHANRDQQLSADLARSQAEHRRTEARRRAKVKAKAPAKPALANSTPATRTVWPPAPTAS